MPDQLIDIIVLDSDASDGVGPLTEAEAWYQGFVDAHQDGSLFHGLGWRRAVNGAFGHQPFYLLAMRAGRAVGVLPLFRIQSVFAGRMLLSVPYATYGGVLADDEDVAEELLARARLLAARDGVRCIELRSMRAADLRSPIRRTHASFQKPLPDHCDAVLESIPRKARAAARRAGERHDLRVEFGEHLLKGVWALYARSMRRLGSPNYPFRFFKELAKAFGDSLTVQAVLHSSRPVCGLLTFRHRDVAMPYFSGVDERVEVYGLNNFLYWQSMRRAVQQGCRVYDFGRTRYDNRGPFEFKESFGFEPRPLEYQTLIMDGMSAPDFSPTSSRWSVARSLWKWLPLPVTRPLGGWLARSIPG